jgi:anthranilate synthase component 2
MLRILILDNYDSFTYNLYHYVDGICGQVNQLDVYRNDQISLADCLSYNGIILSPGPGLPSEAGIMKDLVAQADFKLPILGICLGHQAIGECHGATLEQLSKPLHGTQRITQINNQECPLFNDIPSKIKTGHYHSWTVSKNQLPDSLNCTAIDSDGHIMAISHKRLPQYGIQFHPESIMSDFGRSILSNWLEICKRKLLTD